MSIELGMNGKKLLGPKFSLIYNNSYTELIFGITKDNHKDYSFAYDDFTNNFVSFWYKNRTFFFETKENIYMFDLGDDTFKIPLNTKLYLSLVNLNEENKSQHENLKSIGVILKSY